MNGRSPLGSPAFLWAAGCVFWLVVAAVGRAGLFRTAPSHSLLTAHAPLALGLAAVFLLFSGAYSWLERSGRLSRRWLGALHGGMTLAATVLMMAAILGSTWGPVRAAGLPSVVSQLAGAGYVLAIAAQGLFVLVLLDAFRRRPDLR